MVFASLQHSVFLQALGNAILNSLWQGFIFWFLYESICISYKNASARFKANVSTIFLFCSFIWFLVTFILKALNQTPTIFISTVSPIGEQSTIHSASLMKQFLIFAGSSLPYLSVAYIFLLLFLMVKLFTAYRYVYLVSNKRLMAPPLELQSFASKVALQIGLRKKISVWISHYIDVPATIGFLKPIILIPFASLNNLSGEQLEAIILHELSHIKRNDYFVNILVSVIETILFFNPFVVLLSKAIKRERENCCDDFVLQYQYDPHSYASALLRLEQSRVNTLKLAIGAVSGKKQLLSRIKRITNGQAVVKQFNYGQRLLALLFITAVICSIAWLSPTDKKQESTDVHIKKAELTKFKKTPLPVPKISVSLMDQSETFKANIAKHIIEKKNTATLEPDGQNFLIKDDMFNDDVDSSSAYLQNFAPSENKQLRFYFKTDKLNVPSSVDIKNFPFQNMSFNINLEDMDVNKLSENLKKAYKEINNINWAEVQNNINARFAKENPSSLALQKKLQSYIDIASNFSRIDKDEQRLGNQILRKNFRKAFGINDSSNAGEMQLYLESRSKVREQFEKIRHLRSEDSKAGTYINYSANLSPKSNEHHDNVYIEADAQEPPPAKSKTFTVSVNRTRKRNITIQERKSFQFSPRIDSKENDASTLIHIELIR